MVVQTYVIASVEAGLAGLFGLFAGIASQQIAATPQDGNGSAFLLMLLFGVLSSTLVYLVWLTTENRTTFTLNLSNKSEKS